MLPTILSRCQRFTFKRILPRDIEQQLLKIAQAEGIDLTDDGAELLSRMAGGALRDALSLLDQCRAVQGTLDRQSILNVLGLAGSEQTLQLMRGILSENTGDVLTLFDQLYRAGKSESALLGELSDLARDITVMKAAPEGGDALLSGSYDRRVLQELGRDVPMHRFLYLTSTIQATVSSLSLSPRPRTDTELCLLHCCDESLSGDLTALVSRMEKLEDAVKKGAITVKTAPQSVTAPTPAPVKVTPPPVSDLPWDDAPPPPEEAPPLPEEPPVPTAPVPRPQPAAPSKGGGDDVWGKLLDQYKGRLSVQYRVFLNMASGILQGDKLIVYCNNDFVKTSLNRQEVLSVLREVTSQDQGRNIAVELTVGNAPAASAPAAGHAEKSVPAQGGSHDALEALAQKGRGLSNFKVK